MTEPGLRYLSASDLGVNNHICMLPCGGLSPKQQRLWSASDLDVYLFHRARSRINCSAVSYSTAFVPVMTITFILCTSASANPPQKKIGPSGSSSCLGRTPIYPLCTRRSERIRERMSMCGCPFPTPIPSKRLPERSAAGR